MNAPPLVRLEPHVLDKLMALFGERVSVRESDRLIYARDLCPRGLLALRAGAVAHRPDAVVWP
jgi:hypothetical protein